MLNTYPERTITAKMCITIVAEQLHEDDQFHVSPLTNWVVADT